MAEDLAKLDEDDAGGSHFSTAAQIDRQNVARLQVAWTDHTRALEPATDLGTKMGDSVVAYALP